MFVIQDVDIVKKEVEIVQEGDLGKKSTTKIVVHFERPNVEASERRNARVMALANLYADSTESGIDAKALETLSDQGLNDLKEHLVDWDDDAFGAMDDGGKPVPLPFSEDALDTVMENQAVFKGLFNAYNELAEGVKKDKPKNSTALRKVGSRKN